MVGGLCRDGQHESCNATLKHQNNKKFRCTCSCHPTVDELQRAAAEKRALLRLEDDED